MPILSFSNDLIKDTNQTNKIYNEQNWGIAVALRYANIPYVAKDNVVSTFSPMLFFDDKYFFLNGLESGIKLYESDDWRLSAITRIRYVDIPKDFQNTLQLDENDIGFQTRYKLQDKQYLDMEIMNDLHGRYFSNLKYGTHLENGSFDYHPYAKLQWNNSDFNSYYYGLNQENISSGIDSSIGLDIKYHLISNFYLLGKVELTYINSESRKSTYVEDDFKSELYLGIGFFNDKKKKRKKNLNMLPYLRVAHAWGTPSNIGDIIGGNAEKDPYNNQMTSLFYGYPLTNELFGLPLDFYLTPGFVYHHNSEVQNSTQEYILAIKAYYTLPLPWKVRLGFAEGFSYIENITYIEANEMERKGYEPSNLLNYLDFSIDVHLGDIFGKKLDQLWLGYSIHHRSAIFESSSRFGRIKGGSNYNSVYLQYHF